MEKPVLITIVGTQRFAGDEPDTIELVTHGTYRYEPGCIHGLCARQTRRFAL